MSIMPPSPFLTEPAGMPPAPALTEAAVSADAAASLSVPPGYVLVERELLGRLLKRVQLMAAKEREQLRERLPSFLGADHLRRHA